MRTREICFVRLRALSLSGWGVDEGDAARVSRQAKHQAGMFALVLEGENHCTSHIVQCGRGQNDETYIGYSELLLTRAFSADW